MVTLPLSYNFRGPDRPGRECPDQILDYGHLELVLSSRLASPLVLFSGRRLQDFETTRSRRPLPITMPAARRPNPHLSDPRSWYTLERWRRLRRHQLRTQPLCEMCMARGLVVVASVADHVTPHNGNWNLFLTGKLQSLCASCHSGSKRRIDLGKQPRPYIGEDGWPIE